MKIGLYFGSFNPVHVAHLIIANHILNETDIEKIWFVVSPQNPCKTETNWFAWLQRMTILLRLLILISYSQTHFILPPHWLTSQKNIQNISFVS